MKLTALNAFAAAVDEGSLRRAAALVGVSQPALTRMIRELEIELSATLLVRTSKGVLPTAQGKVLHARAVTVARELSAAVDEISQLGGNMSGDLSIGAVPVAVLLLIPETLRTFGKSFPDIRLHITEELYMAQLHRLRRGDIDIALCGIPPGLTAGEFSVEPLINTRMVGVARKNHPLVKCRSLKELASAKWVYTSTSAESGYARALFESNGLPAPPAGAIVNSTLALLCIIATSDVLGLLPHQIAEHPIATQFVTQIPVEEGGLDLSVGVITRSDSVVSPAIRHFIAHLHRAAHQVKLRQEAIGEVAG